MLSATVVAVVAPAVVEVIEVVDALEGEVGLLFVVAEASLMASPVGQPEASKTATKLQRSASIAS
ncbi:MAG: hypothetical protein R3A79_27690 [Nannocystaceae bacterium]